MRRAVQVAGSMAIAVLLSTAADGQAQPVVRVEVTPDEIPVGEPLTVRVTVLCPTWFPVPPQFPSGELANTITRLPERGSYPTQESVDGESWSGIVYNYEVYPLVGATFEFGGEAVAVTCAEPGNIKGTTVDVPLPEIVFRGVVPQGAESLDPYLAGSYLELDQRVEGDLESIEAGGALIVSYVAELDGLPAMFLPPLVEVPEMPGVSVYADQPIVEDAEPARRTETYTFVFEAGGQFEIPGASLDWWNRNAGQVETASVEPMTVSVTGDPLPAPEQEPPPPEPIDWRKIVIALVVMIGVWKLLSILMPKIRTALETRRAERLTSEEHAFRQLEKALLGGDRRKAQAALLTWLGRITPGLDPREFAGRYGDDTLREHLAEASRALYRESNDDVHMKRLLVPLGRARRKVQRQRREHAEYALPPLNP